MDHELIEGMRSRRRVRADSEADGGGDATFDLPSQVGNKAFTALAQSAVSRAADGSQGAGPLDPEIAADIDAARGGGSALPDGVRQEMEGNLGADLSDVRVHTDSRADGLSRSVQAEAFTTGSDLFFKSGRYEPTSSAGKGLLAHELTHVVQQGSGQVDGGRVSHPDDAHEVEAKAVGDTVASASPIAAPAPAGVSREEEAPEEDELARSVDRQDEEVPEEEEMPGG